MELNREMAVTLHGRYRDDISPGIARTQQIVEQNMRQMSAAQGRTAIVDSETANRWILAAQRVRLTEQQRLDLDYHQAVTRLRQMEFASTADKENLLLELRRTHIVQTQQLQEKAATAAAATAAGTVTAVAAAATAALAVTGAAVYAVVATITGAVERAVAIGNETNRLAVQLNLTAEKLSALGYAAEQNESSIGSLAQSMRRLSVAMTAASDGSKEQIELFQRMGVEFRNAATGGLRDPLAVFIDLARRMRGSQDQALMTAAAVKLFGRSADELLPLIRNIDKFEKSMQEAQAMGFIISAEEARLAADFADSLGTISKMVDVLARSVAAELLPVMMELVQEVKDWWQANHEAVSADVRVLFREVAALLREIVAVARDSGASVSDAFRLATSAGLLFVGMLSNAASGWHRLKEGAASAQSMAAAFLGQFEAAGKFAAEARRAGEMAERLEQIAERSSRTAADVMSGAAEKMFQQAQAAADLMRAMPVAAHAPSQPPKAPQPPDEEAVRQNKEVDQMILAGRRERMLEEERILIDYYQKVADINRMTKADYQKRDEAIYLQTLLYNDKWQAIREKAAADEAAFQERAALAMAKSTERMFKDAERGADEFARQMLEKIRNLNAEKERAFAQETAIVQLEGEVRIARIEIDKTIPDQLRNAMIGLERAQLDVQAAQRDLMWAQMAGDADAAAQAVLRLQAAFLRLQGAQVGVVEGEKKVRAESKTVTNAMKIFGAAVEQAFVASAQAAMMSGQNMRKAIADQLQAIGVQEAILAVVELAKYFASLWLNPAEAATHLMASKLHLMAAAMIGATGAAAGIGAGGGGTGGGGGGNGQNYGPREYTSEDIARIRAQGRGDTATGAGESAADAQRPIVVNHFHNKILTPDVASTKRWFDKQQALFTRGAAVEMARNPAVAKAIGQLATRER